jgi:predicted permease
MAARDHEARGASPEEARYVARREFGNGTLVKEVTRQVWGGLWLDDLGRDLRYALRSLRSTPGFSAAVVLTLALGLGANTTMFGVLDTLLLKPPAHVRDPGRVQRLYLLENYGAGAVFTGTRASFLQYERLRSVSAFQALAASFFAQVSLGRGADARQVDVSAVTASYFPLLGVRPALGRFFDSTEELPGGTPVAVVSWRYWRGQLQGAPAVLGRTLPIGRFSYTIVGVAPRDFAGADPTGPDIWLPLRTAAPDLNNPQALTSRLPWIEMLARLAPGVRPAVAAAQATLAYRRASERPFEKTTTIMLRSIREARSLLPIQEGGRPRMTSDAEVALWVGGLALAVLLVACANVANLLLARGLRRRRELALRLGLGAGRARLIRQMLVESALLAAAGGVAALLVAMWGGAAIRAFLLPGLSHSINLLEPRLLLFTAAVATLAGLLAGGAPAWLLSGTDVAASLRSGGRDVTSTRGRLRSSLLTVQVALTLALLVGAGLFVRSLRNVETLDYGLDVQHLIIADLRVPGRTMTFTLGGEEDPRSAQYLRLLRHIQANPAVASAAASVGTPYRSSYCMSGLKVSGGDTLPTGPSGAACFNAVSADYFLTAGIPIIRGRGFTEADEVRGAPRVAVVGRTFARLAWPDRNPIGQCLFVGGADSACIQVIGVAGDERPGVRDEPGLAYYLPYGQHLVSPPIDGLLIRTRASAEAAQGEVRHALQAGEPDLPYVHVESLADRLVPLWRSWRLGAVVFSAFGLLALTIAALGLYAVTAYGVTQRTQEIGVRMAFGAQRSDVISLAVWQALRATTIGAGAGLLAAVLLARAVRALLFQVQPVDPATLVAGIGLLLVVAAAAAFMPARRAAHVDPMEALRCE